MQGLGVQLAHSASWYSGLPKDTKMAKRAHTVNFLFKNEDYMTATLDNGGVRIGFIGGIMFDVPKGHAYFDRISEADCAKTVEDLHDELMSVNA